jgi:signal transduction histidine kinase
MVAIVAHPQADSSVELALLANEQAALRRLATLIARGAPPAQVFEAVITEVGRLLPADGAALSRFGRERTLTPLGYWSGDGGYVPGGSRHPLEPGTLGALVYDTHRPGRIERYAGVPGSLARLVRSVGWRSGVGAPILVDGSLWGLVAVGSTTDRQLPVDTEARLADFAELLATAIGNAESHAELARLAEEQAALRRVATLVAQGAPTPDVFWAVVSEVGKLSPADAASLMRYETDGVTTLSTWSRTGPWDATGPVHGFEEGTATVKVLQTGRAARVDSYDGQTGEMVTTARQHGWRSSVGVPIVVDRRLWGVVVLASTRDEPLPADTEERLTGFTELLATSIANAESRAELCASRARIVATADATRRRIERNIHDGAQQRLVALALEVRAAQAAVPPQLSEHRAELSRVVDGLRDVMDELREIAGGLHPSILTEGGLEPALKTLARRSRIPVDLDLRVESRFPEGVEGAAYYTVSEALTNAAKHAHASVVHVHVKPRDGVLRVVVSDDGAGGADPARGTGLVGLRDRAEALGGTIVVLSPPGAGTSVQVELPLVDHRR